ncbi:MAG: hypothetical protein EAZ97_13150 [Bacteroidetes bacterium]|nr:MAG: hypothetical protein EAZ97_13150 [Bacteroidota bacterium]
MKKITILGIFMSYFFSLIAVFAQKKEDLEINYPLNRYAMVPLPADIKTYQIVTKWNPENKANFQNELFVGDILVKPLPNNSVPEARYENRQEEIEKQFLAIENLEQVSNNPDLIVELYLGRIDIVSSRVSEKAAGKRKNGSLTYNRSFEFHFQSTLTLKRPNGKVIFQKTLSYENKLQHENYTEGDYLFTGDMEDTQAQFLEELSKRMYYKAGKAMDENIFRKEIMLRFDLLTFSSKNHEYTDFDQALTQLKAGLDTAATIKLEKEKFKESYSIYQKALAEFSEDKKARINKKVKEETHFLMALSAYFLNDFSAAKATLKEFGDVKDVEEKNEDEPEEKEKRGFFNVSIDGGIKSFFQKTFDKKDKDVVKIKNHQHLYNLIIDTEKRHKANGLIK